MSTTIDTPHKSLRLLRREEAALKCSVSLSTVMRWATDPKYAHTNFPKPIRVNGGATVFFEHEIDEWLAAYPRVEQR